MYALLNFFAIAQAICYTRRIHSIGPVAQWIEHQLSVGGSSPSRVTTCLQLYTTAQLSYYREKGGIYHDAFSSVIAYDTQCAYFLPEPAIELLPQPLITLALHYDERITALVGHAVFVFAIQHHEYAFIFLFASSSPASYYTGDDIVRL